jgi:hypothetical protein
MARWETSLVVAPTGFLKRPGRGPGQVPSFDPPHPVPESAPAGMMG